MPVIGLAECSAAPRHLVGGKAAALGALILRGEQVPPGFCVTTAAGDLSRAQIAEAYEGLGGGRVAVRSSAPEEDGADASYAGQYDTILDVEGADAVLAAVETCRRSAPARAAAYREARGGGRTGPIAVIVQRMVDVDVAGVLFTANPLTGCRTEMTVDAAPGAGPAVVDGAGPVDHYVIGARSPEPAEGGCLANEALSRLRDLGERLQAHFGGPQDIEWAFDKAGELWVVQSRAITTLFPLPPATEDLRVYLEFGHVQGMLQPVTPMGMSTLKALVTAMLRPLGLHVTITDIGGRLYGDMTDLVRDPKARKRLVRLLAVDFGPRAQDAIRHLLDDPRFAPVPGRAKRRGGPSLGTAAGAVVGIARALARPAAARRRAMAAVERLRQASSGNEPVGLPSSDGARDQAGTERDLTVAERLRIVRAWDDAESPGDLVWPIAAGMLAATVPEYLLKGRKDEVFTVLAGMPHNVTIEMDLALWRLARQVPGEQRDLLLGASPAELAGRWTAGTLPEFGLGAFLSEYGHRGAAEVDLGVPRWAEDPAPVFAALQNYLRVEDPEQAPDRRFASAAESAEAALRDVRRRHRAAGFLLGRARELAGLREAGKFAGLYRLQQMRRQLLLIGAELFEDPADVMFVTIDELGGAVPDKTEIEARKALYRRETRRRVVPVALLSDGTDVEATLPAADGADLRGVAASAGRVTGKARIVRDPADAYVEPGEVLVTATTDPGWTPLFLTAAALVTETGAVMAHGPTVAREYGIPAVICVPGATERIRTGEVVTVDGRAGTVTRG
ncbi:pyruvate, water dikinase [Paractinoplanes atraurantiacus]|uniref:Pyruvate, water dikinase n=2 Tax=Paractinoplanes atraurantiacus TaxID=1036182 RepID=A0A285HZP0_9ACTN|nr:pyruvate, water dikinase [Actinoplanes atraurantiacus]